MVDDSGTDSLICWQPDGKTFIVPNHVRFAKEVLPRFFKHNNFPSFVRQLNMYGFHKVPSLQQGSLKHEQEMEIWEFEEKNFQRDRPDLMGFMQRKKGTKAGDDKEKSGGGANAGGDDDEDKNKALVDNKVSEGLTSVSGALTRAGESESLMQLTNVWQAIQAIQNAQTSINDNLRHLSLSNDELWKETMEQKRRSEQQAETINRMLRFLAGVYAGHDGLVNGDGGTPSKGRNRRGAGGAGGDAGGRADSTPSSPRGSLFRNSSSGGPLLIEGAKPDDVSGDDNEEANSAQIHELFSRFSEATNSPEANGNGSGNGNSGANIFDANSPGARFSTIPSPRGGRSRSSSPSQLIPSSPQPPSSATPRRPALLGDTPRRATTPGPAKAGRSMGLSGQQILQALSSGEGQALLQQLMGGSGNGTSAGSIDPAKQLDPNMLAALFAAFQGANANANGSGGQSNAGSSTPGPSSSNFQPWQPNDDDSSRFTYPSISNADTSSSALARLPAWQQHQLTAQHGVLQQTEQSAGLLQHAIEQLAGSVPRPPTSGSGPDSAFSAAGSHAPIAGPAPAPAAPTPGDWSQFAGGAVDPNAAAGTPGLSNDLDMDDLLASFINTNTPGNGSGGGGIEELLPTPPSGSANGSGEGTPTASGVEETGKVTTRAAGRKRKDLEEGEDSSPATASKARFGTNTRVEDAE